jgi:NOL1/NOP2/sun family putative RNA methylase
LLNGGNLEIINGMKRKSAAEKLISKREAWINRTAAALAVSSSIAAELLRTPRRQSLRLNPLRGGTQEALTELREAGWQGRQYPWYVDGYTIESAMEPVRDSPAVSEGRVFIQNAASWLPVLALDPQPNDTILDVCAAPGGKTSHIAALTANQAHIWANDNSRARLAKLQANMRRLGVSIEQYTLYDATTLTRKLQGQQFDRILLDAPCSGEGLMNLSKDTDVATWSVAHIKRLQQLQKRILSQSWQLLKPGGVLVYSTCTMAPEENEAVVDYLLRTHSDAHTMPLDLKPPNRIPTVREWNGRVFAPDVGNCVRLQPSESIEAFFVCKLEKVGISE